MVFNVTFLSHSFIPVKTVCMYKYLFSFKHTCQVTHNSKKIETVLKNGNNKAEATSVTLHSLGEILCSCCDYILYFRILTGKTVLYIQNQKQIISHNCFLKTCIYEYQKKGWPGSIFIKLLSVIYSKSG